MGRVCRRLTPAPTRFTRPLRNCRSLERLSQFRATAFIVRFATLRTIEASPGTKRSVPEMGGKVESAFPGRSRHVATGSNSCRAAAQSNERTSGNGAIAFCFDAQHLGRAVPDLICWAILGHIQYSR